MTTVQGPRLLVLKEKHEPIYFHCPDEAALHAAALLVLTGRLKSGYWYHEPPASAEPARPDYADPAEIATLRGNVQKKARALLYLYKENLQQHEREVAGYARIKAAVAAKDGAAAWQCLLDRRDGEYEGVRLEPYATKYTG